MVRQISRVLRMVRPECLKHVPALGILAGCMVFNAFAQASANIDTCSRTNITANAGPADREVAMRILFWKSFGFKSDDDAVGPRKHQFAINQTIQKQWNAGKGAFIPGMGPQKGIKAYPSGLMDERVSPGQVTAIGYIDTGSLALTIGEHVLWLAKFKQAASSWSCTVWIGKISDLQKLTGVSNEQIEEADLSESRPLKFVSAANPLRTWGEKNRCLWDEKFARGARDCGNNAASTQPQQAPVQALVSTGKGPADANTVVAACQDALRNATILGSSVKSIERIAFGEPIKAGEMSRPFDTAKSTPIYPTRITMIRQNGAREYTDFYVYKSTFGDLQCHQ